MVGGATASVPRATGCCPQQLHCVQLVLIMQPDDGWAFCSEPVALHRWCMDGIASLWFNMLKNTELVRGFWCNVA